LVLLGPLSVLVFLTGCGTRLSHEAIVRDAAGGAAVGTAVNGTTGGSGGTTGSGEALPSTGSSGTSATTGAGTSGSASTGGATSSTGTGTGTGTGGATGAAGTATGGSTSGTAPASGDHTPVILGQVGTFSGIVGAAEGTAQAATNVWVRWTNAHGGLAGHPIKFFSYDDAASASKAQSEMRDLVENKHAVAVVGAFVPLTIQAVAPYADQHKIPVVGGDVSGPDWNKHPYMFPMGSASDALSVTMAQAMAQRNQTKVAVFYCTESNSCSAAVTALQKGADKYHLQVVYKAAVSLAQPDFTAQCAQAHDNGAQAIFMAAGGDDAQRAARDCKKIPGYQPTWWSSALAINEQVAKDPNLDGVAIMSDVAPWFLNNTPAEHDFQNAMKTYAPDLPVVGANAQAWASGQLLAAAVNAMSSAAHQGPITSAMIAEGLWKLKDETLGGFAPKLNFLRGKPAPPANCTFYAEVAKGGWSAPYGEKQFCY
jgi:branched-chain amino acid transport system substrate-binding protein